MDTEDFYKTTTCAFFLLVANCAFLTFSEIRARTVTGALAVAEDTKVNKKEGAVVPLLTAKPAALARASQAHANATENFVPFFLAVVVFFFGIILYSLHATTEPDYTGACILEIIFVVTRWAHTICYLGGFQPWRTLVFTISFLAYVVLACYGMYFGFTT